MKYTKRHFELAETARREARKWQDKKDNDETFDDLPAPGIDKGYLAEETHKLVLASILRDSTKDVIITIPAWDQMAPPDEPFPDVLTVYHQVGDAGERQEIFNESYTSDDYGSFPLQLSLGVHSEAYGADATHIFFYVVDIYSGGASPTSERLRLIFDRTSPPNNGLPDPLPAISPVTDTNVGTITVTLPEYADRATDALLYDQVLWYWLEEVPEDFTGLIPAGTAPVTQANQVLAVPADKIKAAGDGDRWISYVLVDKAGNIGRPSYPTKVQVALGALPTNLQDPVVPLAPADDLVDLEDAMLGVKVRILAFDNYKPTDEINVTWGATGLGWRAIGAGGFPQDFPVSTEILRATYGTPAEGTKAVDVSYEVRRGTLPQGVKAIKVDTNFEIIGPVDPGTDPVPEWPDITNPRLPLPDVYGDSSSTPNVLIPADDGKDASLEVDLYDGAEEDDLMQFFWGGKHIREADYKVLGADAPGDKVTAMIPWSYIQETGNTTVEVHYTIFRETVPNTGKSGKRQVKVDAVVLHPDAPVFDGVNARGYLVCDALVDPVDSSLPPAVRVEVGDLSQYGLKDGDEVELFWWALHGASGDTEVLDARFNETIELGADYPATGFIWRIPYAEYVLPIYEFDSTNHSGRGFCRYEFNSGAVVSDVVKANVAMHDASTSCPITPWPPVP